MIKKQYIISCMLCLLFSIAWSVTPEAMAGEPGVFVRSVQQEDLDNDGQPDLTIINFMLEAVNDRVLVYDQGNDMVESDDWQGATDFTNDIWVFDIGGNGDAQLIIRFVEEEGNATAYLYEDRDDDGAIAYEIVNDWQVLVSEPGDWALRVQAEGSWYLEGDTLNQSLRFEIDGYLDEHEQYFLDTFLDGLVLDNRPDFEVEVIDTDLDGIPEYAHRNLLAPSDPTQFGFTRHTTYANEGRYRSSDPDDYIFWPLLGGNYSGNYFDTPPHILIDWDDANIVFAGIIGYPIEHGYHITNIAPWQKDEINYVNFENPMAYYDLAADRDGLPEMFIRMVYSEDDDPLLQGGNYNTTFQTIRYSWNQTNNSGLLWDYGVNLAGTYEITSVTEVGSFQLRTIPHMELPHWVTERDWGFGTFVSREGRGYASSEGLYDWNIDPDSSGAYLSGSSPSWIADDGIFGLNIRIGFRGEYAELRDQPYLYFSPIDRELHILRAHQGMWNIDGQTAMYYDNLNNDSYIDQWLYIKRVVDNTQSHTLTHRLNVTDSHLIYSDNECVLLREMQIEDSLFETLPPTNHQEWLQLGNQLDRHEREFEPGDLRSMFDQFSGPTTEIEGALLRDFRFTADGFRFVMTLEEDHKINGTEAPIFENLAVGKYAVFYDGTFRTEPLTPPELSIHSISSIEGREEISTQIQAVEIRNDGLEDVYNLQFIATAQLETQSTPIVTQTVSVFNDASQWIVLDNQPLSPEPWTLHLSIQNADGKTLVEQSIEIDNANVENRQQTVLRISNSDGLWWRSPPFLLLYIVALIAVFYVVGLALSSDND